jgi:DegV family protein with EDD domain
MKQVCVITDSVACLTHEQAKKHKIEIVPMKILYNGIIYRDGIDLSSKEAYRFLEKSPDSFSTAPSNPVDYIDIFTEKARKGYDILCITVSSQLSTTYNVARIAADNVKTAVPDAQIEILDSANATASQGFIAMEAAKQAAQNKDLASVLSTAKRIKERVKVYLVLDTIEHAYRTGRIPKIASQMGSVLGVKPLITITDGVVHFVSAVRSSNRGISKMLEIIKREVGGNSVHMAVMHTDVSEEANNLKKKVEREFNCTELFITEVSPVIGYSIGRGTLALAYYP